MRKTNNLYITDLQSVLNVPGIERLHNKRFLITGATGMVGMHLIDALMLLDGVEVYAVGRSKERATDRLGEYYAQDNFHFIEQDVCNPLPEVDVDYIIPLASNTHPLAYSQYPIETLLINIKGAEHALNCAVRCGAMVLYPSTVEVYGNAIGDDVFTEGYTGKLNLSNSRACYSESKRSAEALCQSYIAERNARVKIVRLSRLFGPTMLLSDSKASSQFIKKAVAGEDIVLKSEGNQFFSYTYVSDAVNAMLHVLLHGEEGVAYNISNELCDVRLKEFAGLCAESNGKEVVFDLPSEIERKGFSIAAKAILDNSLLKSIGWKAQYDIRKALHNTINILEDK